MTANLLLARTCALIGKFDYFDCSMLLYLQDRDWEDSDPAGRCVSKYVSAQEKVGATMTKVVC